MKFHRLTMRNLNALYGDQTVDFDSWVGSAGLFLIHGPMGAGKSTILDAICLALFGDTPRLNSRSPKRRDGLDEGAGDENPLRMMSHGTGDCMAQLELSVAEDDGTRARYRMTWRAARAYKRPNGRFQAPEREVEQWVDGAWKQTVRSAQDKDYRPHVERVLRKLSFDEFQRSVLLAQFKFREFLDAEPEARAAILERMTDSGAFRAIGKEASNRCSAAERARDLVQAELASVTLLDDAARAELEAELIEVEARAERARNTAAERQLAIGWWERLASARQGLTLAEQGVEVAAAQAERAAPALAALAEDERLEPAREALAEALAQRERAQAAAAAVTEAERERRITEDAAAAAATASAASAAALDAARQTAADQLPAIEAAEAVWAAAAEAERVAAAAAVAAATAREAAERADRAFEAADVDARRLEDALAACDRQLADIPGHAVLAESIGAIRLHAADRARANQTLRTADTALRALADTIRAHADTLEGLQHTARGARTACEQAAADLAEATTALEHAAGGASAAEAEQALEAGRNAAIGRQAALDALARRWEEHATAERARGLAAGAEEEARAEAARLAEEARVAADQSAAQKQLAEAHARTVDALAQLLGALAFRGVLHEGEPCPVCGGADHPYRTHPERAPTQEGTQSRHAAAVALQQEAAATWSRDDAAARQAAERAAAAKATAGTLARTLDERTRERDDLRATLRRISAELGLAESPDAVEHARQDTRAEAERLEVALRTLRTRLSARQAAHERHADAARAEERAEGELARHAEREQSLKQQIERAEADVAAATTHAREAHASLLEALRGVGIEPEDIDTAVATAGTRLDEVQRIEAERAGLALALPPAAEARAGARTRAELARKDADRLEADAASAERDRNQRCAEAEATLGGQRPAAVRGALAAAIEQAERTAGTARDAAANAQARLLADTAVLEERVETHGREASAAQTLDAALRARLVELGIADAAALQAASLDDDAREDARALRRQVHDAQKAADARRDEAARVHADVLAARPEAEPDVAEPDARIRTLRDEAAGALEAEGAANKRVGTVRAMLDADSTARVTHARHADALRLAEEDLKWWSEVHALIGVNDGGRFAMVVQGFNLRRVLDHANDYLERFMPRYALQQVIHKENGPLLDFRVLDHDQQDDVRSIKSLSGGESFIVSLALALGLAATRSSRMRIETLLIDEGFGSLDHRKLAEATAALAALQSAIGVQIGVISHVEHLREAIPAQIVVEPLGAGRSQVHPPATRAGS